MFSVLVIRLRSLRLLRVSGIVMRLRMFLLLITFVLASHSFRNRLLVICKNAYLFATMIMTSEIGRASCRERVLMSVNTIGLIKNTAVHCTSRPDAVRLTKLLFEGILNSYSIFYAM